MKKTGKILVAVIAVCCVAGIIGKDFLIKSAIETAGSFVVGADIKIQHFSLSLLKQKVSIKGFVLYNPPGFPREPMVDMEEATIQCDIPAIIKKDLHLPLMVLKMKEVVIIKNKEGKLNVDALKIAQKQEEQEAPRAKKKKGPQENIPMRIDTLTLTLGRVVSRDFTKGDTAKEEVFTSPVTNKTYKNITSAQALAAIILSESLKGAAIKGAMIYGAAALTGVGFIPVVAASVLTGKDSVESVYQVSIDAAYAAVFSSMEKMGKITMNNQKEGIVKAAVSGCSAAAKITQLSDSEIKVVISARKMMMPQQGIAAGIMRQVEEALTRKE